MGGNNSNGTCFSAARVGDKIEFYKAPDFGNAVAMVTDDEYTDRLTRAKEGKEEWPGGHVTPDARQMIQPPEDYDMVYTEGERYAHACAIGQGLMDLAVIVEAQGEPVIAKEYMDGANPYAGPVVA